MARAARTPQLVFGLGALGQGRRGAGGAVTNDVKLVTVQVTYTTASLMLALLPASMGSAVALRAETPASLAAAPDAAEIQRLRELLVRQQEQIEALRAAVTEQQKMLDRVASVGERSGALAFASPGASRTGTEALREDGPATEAPLQLRVGNAAITPVGFIDATAVWRDKNAGSGIGAEFGAIPFNNSERGHLTEVRFSPQNSRLGFRVDAAWKGARFLAYNEFDFLGAPAANNIGITNGAFVPRLRQFWVSAQKGSYEIQAGQSWSMMTPNRRGISALPENLFYSQVVDVNYVAGLPWTRQAGVRFLYRPSTKTTLGLSLEEANQYAGGSGGAGTITPPAGLASLVGGQLDDASTPPMSTPNLHPDIIGKFAFDPGSRAHFEVAAGVRTFKVFNPLTNRSYIQAGVQASINANFEIVRNVRLVTNNFLGSGGGRYLFGQAPDVILRSDGSMSPVRAAGVVEGLEVGLTPALQLYAYYGGVYIGRNVALDAAGRPAGYGYSGSPDNHNRVLHEVTAGFTQTFWKDPRYGQLSFMAQYAYLLRNPWWIAPGAPKSAHNNAVFLNLRYALPGSAPAVNAR